MPQQLDPVAHEATLPPDVPDPDLARLANRLVAERIAMKGHQ